MRLISPSDNLCTTGSPVTQNTCQPGTCRRRMRPLRLKMFQRRTRCSPKTLRLRIYLACSRCTSRWMLHLHAQNACPRHRPLCLSNPQDNNTQQGTPSLHLTRIDEHSTFPLLEYRIWCTRSLPLKRCCTFQHRNLCKRLRRRIYRRIYRPHRLCSYSIRAESTSRHRTMTCPENHRGKRTQQDMRFLLQNCYHRRIRRSNNFLELWYTRCKLRLRRKECNHSEKSQPRSLECTVGIRLMWRQPS